jgi:NAD(P)-dependent dehydrogenase (short-subunit alcohol dehydrogenase family)
MSPFNSKSTGDEVVTAFADNVKGRTFLITGATAGGLGATAALTLARQAPAHIILVSRTKAKVEPVLSELASTAPAVKTTFVTCELSDFASVRAAASIINNDADIQKIDVVLNNAGVMAIPNYTLDKQGNELTLSSNHLGHFLLTNLLLPKLLAGGSNSRIVNMTSQGHTISPVRFDDYNFTSQPDGEAYDPWTSYGQSKTASALFSVSLTQKLAKHGVESFSAHPGVIYTNLALHLEMKDFEVVDSIAKKNTGRGFQLDPFKTLQEGISTMLVASLDPELKGKGGSYIANCQIGEPYEYAVDPENAEKLWSLSEKLVGQKFEL